MTAMTAVGPDFSFTAAGLAGLPDDGREYELRDGCLVIRGPEPFTVDDLDAMSDDPLCYELIDGIVYVSPPPGWSHQFMLGEIFVVLRAACPPDLRVGMTIGYRPDHANELVPDLVVVRRSDAHGVRLEGTPLLAVEVASPSTSRYDRVLKRQVYEARGVPSYWLLDPRKPSITVLELVDGRYEQVAAVTGAEPLTVQRPYPVTLTPTVLATR